MPIASLHPKIESVTPTGDKLLVKRQADDVKVGEIWMPENAMHVGLAKFDVIGVSKKVLEEHGIGVGDVIYAPRVLGYQRVELPKVGLCHFIPILSVQAHLPKCP
jgi:hypothetical protein